MQTRLGLTNLKQVRTFNKDKFAAFSSIECFKRDLVARRLRAMDSSKLTAPWKLAKESRQEDYWTQSFIISPNLSASLPF